MLASDYQAERTMIQTVLGCANDATDLRNYLELALNPGEARLNLVERIRIFTAPVESMSVGVQVMIDFVRENFDAINEIQQGTSNSILSAIAARTTSPELFESFDSLLIELEGPEQISEEFGISLRASAQNIFEWQERYAEEIRDLLATRLA